MQFVMIFLLISEKARLARDSLACSVPPLLRGKVAVTLEWCRVLGQIRLLLGRLASDLGVLG